MPRVGPDHRSGRSLGLPGGDVATKPFDGRATVLVVDDQEVLARHPVVGPERWIVVRPERLEPCAGPFSRRHCAGSGSPSATDRPRSRTTLPR